MNCSTKTLELCQGLIEQLRLPADFMTIVQSIYVPLAQMIIDHKQSSPLIVSINGAQGTGKSTITAFISLIIESEFSQRVAALSLDDFYHTRAERERIAAKVHPLLVTRGVPGTHDVDRLEQVLGRLLGGQACVVPRFNKAIDDRMPEQDWHEEPPGAGIILFEGWCNSSPPQADDALLKPINRLEATEDLQGVWRQYVNEQLKQYHQRIFDQAGLCIMLQVPGFEHIYEWRRLQEQKLREQTPADQQHALLDDVALRRFIDHYERISRHTLEHLPAQADILIPIEADHSIRALMVRHDQA